MPAKKVAAIDSLVELTHSAKGDFLDCNQKYHLKYEQQLSAKAMPTALVIGSIVHEALESLLSGFDIDHVMANVNAAVRKARANTFEDPEEFESDATTLEAMIRGWNENRGPHLADFQVWPSDKDEPSWLERAFEVKLGNDLVLRGKMDGVAKEKDGPWIVEHKTSSQLGPSYIDRLLVDAQVTMYHWAFWKVTGIMPKGTIYNVIRKPSIRQTKKETLAQFQERILSDYQTRPEFYFYQTKLYRDSEQLRAFENSLMDVADDIRRNRSRGRWTQNTNTCMKMGKCAMFPICSTGMKPEVMAMYHKRDVKFPELVAE